MVTLNGDPSARYCGNLNLSFAHVEGESLLMVSQSSMPPSNIPILYLCPSVCQALKNVAVSSGSACTSASLEPSYVLRALGRDDESAHSSLRLGIGRFTTEAEVDLAVDLLEKHVHRST